MLKGTIVNGNKNKNTDREQVKNAVLKLETLTLSVIKTQIQSKKSKEDVAKLFTKMTNLTKIRSFKCCLMNASVS